MTDAEKKQWNKLVERQSLSISGFCAYCGEAVAPFVKGLPQEFIDASCEYDGKHPDCDDHNMVFKEKASTVFSGYEGYEIHECTKCGMQDAL